MAVSNPYRNTSSSIEYLDPHALNLLQSGLAESTRKYYRRSWELFFNYNNSKNLNLPLSKVDICNFIGFLFEQSFSPSSITSHVSAISYIHKLLDIQNNSNSFIVRKMLKGCSNTVRNPSDSRLPITKEILHKMLLGMDKCISDWQIKVLLRAVFLLAFNALLRLGEILVRSYSNASRVVQVHDIKFSEQYINGYPTSLTLTLRHFKNMKNNQPIEIMLEAISQQPNFCPVQALYTYFRTYKLTSGP